MLESGVLSIAAGLFMIGFLVVIHEAGHFFAAKLFGVGAPIFSVGFGPRVAGFVWRGTDYRLSALPFGGYVRMLGADPFGGEEEDADARVPPHLDFMKKPVWQRLIIMAAGPSVNLLLPIVLFAALFMAGRPTTGPYVGEVLPGTVAAAAGFHTGDQVVAVGGEAVGTWIEVEDALMARTGVDTPVRVLRDGVETDLSVPAAGLQLGEDGLFEPFTFGAVPYLLTARIGVDGSASPAARAGLVVGDLVRSVDGAAVTTYQELMAALSGSQHTLVVQREGEELSVTLSADAGAAYSPIEAPYANRWGVLPVVVFATSVQEDSPAALAGVQATDRLLAVDGEAVLSFDHLRRLVARTGFGGGEPRSLELEVVRDGQRVSSTLTPHFELLEGEAFRRPVIGIASYTGGLMWVATVNKAYGPVASVQMATEQTGRLLEATASMLYHIVISREADASKNVGGPVAIFNAASDAVQEGLATYLMMLAQISLSLGFINLLPVPGLDGGHILFYLVEVVRGRPLSLELREKVQMVGVLGLVVLMVLVTANDITRAFGG